MKFQLIVKSSAKAKAILTVAALIAVVPIQRSTCAADLGDKSCKVWEVLEWEIENSDCPVSNPYDLVAKVVFTHEGGRTRQIEMFYAGKDTWKFRFCGSRLGKWSFRTVCDGSAGTHNDSSLHNHIGRITVSEQTNQAIKGFLSHKGNKFAIMDRDETDLKPYVYQVYMNQQDFEQQYNHSSRIWDDPVNRRHLVADYWNDTVDNGFRIYFVGIFYSWFKKGALDRNMVGLSDVAAPDPDVFDALEYAIRYAHERGGRTHIWAWGDQDRKQTANLLPGGVLGDDHKRLMRYMAARLGPLPGWAMNFGFDTIELPDPESMTSEWADYLNERMGWRHMLCARGWNNSAFGINSYAGFGGGYELTTTKNGPSGYEEIRDDLDGDSSKPHLYEERHTYSRFKYVAPGSCREPGDGPDQYGMADGYACWPIKLSDVEQARLNEDGSRRLIWREQMAGGMGGFFGHFSVRFNSFGPFSDNCGCGYHPESLKRAFRCFRDFWAKDRFTFDMAPDAGRVRGRTGYCLRTQDYRRFVFFIEDAGAVEIDLGGMPGSRQVVAVDAKKQYNEINKGTVTAGWRTIDFGYTSDWAVAVGDFGDKTKGSSCGS
ncbi:MAG: DUF5060 domain-containing protein [Phycisphaerales bacterium]|nr:MAG: DUF5060 domain-containing protein [Phycisphaerales bacterium]